MKCDICLRENAETVGIRCGIYKVCNPCIDSLIKEKMETR
jgi:hypothetical protein